MKGVRDLIDLMHLTLSEVRAHPALLAAPFARYVLGLRWDICEHRWIDPSEDPA